MFIIGALTFVTASAVGGLAPWFGVLLAARVAQGAAGALMLPATVAIVNSTFPPEQRGRARWGRWEGRQPYSPPWAQRSGAPSPRC